jgi:acarbose 7IV-phosphotransferase
LHLADLGLPVRLHTVIGSDAEAERIRSALSDERIRLVPEFVEGPSERHLNLMAGGDRLSIYLSLPAAPTGPLPAATQDAIARARHVVLDLSERSKAAIPLATASAATVWTDLHNYDGESAFHQPFLDAADIVFLSNDVVPNPRDLMSRILATGKRLVVCTLGADGALALDRDGWHRVEAAPVEVVDTNGAGDAFLAGFLAGDGTVPDRLRAGGTQAARALRSRHLSPLLDRT